MRKTKIIVHCTDSPHSMGVTVDDLHQWHVVENRWSAIGYAYYIDQHGEEHKCRDLDNDGDVEDEIGAHAAGFNRDSIGICLEGRHHFNDCQFDMLRERITKIISRHGIKLDDIGGHCDYDPSKTCPGFSVSALLKSWNAQ